MNLNMHQLINPLISSIVNNQNIIICVSVLSQDNNFNMMTTYNQVTAQAQMQLANNQKLMHKEYYQQNQIYKYFYIANDQLTGFNRNLSTNGDYIIWNNLYYKLVEVDYNFQTGWVKVLGCESTDFISG